MAGVLGILRVIAEPYNQTHLLAVSPEVGEQEISDCSNGKNTTS